MTKRVLHMVAAFLSIRFISPFTLVRRSLLRVGPHVQPWSISTSSLSDSFEDRTMENVHRSWTVEEDQLLYNHRREPLPKLASLLGRGLRGVQARLDKLSDTNSIAYARLFMDASQDCVTTTDSSNPQETRKFKLSTAHEVLQRIRWDPNLQSADFSVLYFDRMEETILESAFDATNDSVNGQEDLFVFAIPEHRIMAIRYKERVVWDRNKRVDCVFGSMGQRETILDVVQSYSEWKRNHDQMEAIRCARQAELSEQIHSILGDLAFQEFKTLSTNILQQAQSTLPIPEHIIHDYCQCCLSLFRSNIYREDPDIKDFDRLSAKTIYLEAVDAFSNLVSFMPHENLRERILSRLQIELDKLSNKPIRGVKENLYQLPELKEEELSEKFVKGGGAGGQKINKTSNKVILVHEPTQIRVECQETRSLQQNRKIARKKLQLKLDEYYNGSMSRTGQKIARAASKKAKADARNKERQREREMSKNMERESNDVFSQPSPANEYT